jgi:hypothetical protein
MIRVFLFLLCFLSFTQAGLNQLREFVFFGTHPDSVLLDSTEELYSGGILSIEQAGTYYLRTEINSNSIDKYLYIAPSPYSLSLYLNDHIIYEWGKPQSVKTIANYDAEVVHLPNEFFTDSSNTLLIEFYSDGARIAPPQLQIGSFDETHKKKFWISLLNHQMIQIIVGIGVFSFLFLFLYLVLVRFEDRSLLFLALFCLGLVATYSMFILNSYHFDQVLLFKIGRIGGVSMSLTLFLFVSTITGYLKQHTYRLIVSAAFVPYVFMIISSGSKFEINGVFNAATNTLIFPLFIVGLIMLIVSIVKSHRLELIAVLIPYLILMGAVFSDMGYMLQFQQPNFWKIPYGYLTLVAGGTYYILYTRTRKSGQFTAETNRLETAIETLKTSQKSNTLIMHRLLSEFATVSRHSEKTFKILMRKFENSEGNEEVSTLYHLFLNFYIYSHNMIYFDKIKQGELYLWNDGFSLSAMFDNRLDAFEWIAEEKGVELQMIAKKHTFPPLVWGDQQAVLIAISNLIITAVEIERHLLRVKIHYIPYTGLEITIRGNDDKFSEQFESLIKERVYHDEPFGLAIVLDELSSRLDAKFEFIQNREESYTSFIIPLKLSEN